MKQIKSHVHQKKNGHIPAKTDHPHNEKKHPSDVDEHADRTDEYDEFNKQTGDTKVEPVMEESHKTAHD